jgi:phage replication-related protein YjqB (UPF0714/DUF867 family)
VLREGLNTVEHAQTMITSKYFKNCHKTTAYAVVISFHGAKKYGSIG